MSNFANKSISLGSLKSLRIDSRYIFAGILLIILAMEVKVVKGELAIASQLRNKVEALPAHASTARVNFTDYNWIVQRIGQSQNFHPSGGITKNPFGVSSQ